MRLWTVPYVCTAVDRATYVCVCVYSSGQYMSSPAQSFVRLVLEAHHLPPQADVTLVYQDPASLSDLLPLRDTPSLCRALQSVSSPPLRIVVQLRSGLWEREVCYDVTSYCWGWGRGGSSSKLWENV